MIGELLNYISSKLAFLYAKKIVANFFSVSNSKISIINVLNEVYFQHINNDKEESKVQIIDLDEFNQETEYKFLKKKYNNKYSMYYFRIKSSFLDLEKIDHEKLISFIGVLNFNNNSRVILYKITLLNYFYIFVFNEN